MLRKRYLCAALTMLALSFGLEALAASNSVKNLRCEYQVDPINIDTATPRLSWTIEAPEGVRGVKQSAYQVLAASRPALLAPGKADLWDSGKVVSDRNHLVDYGGEALRSRQACFWKVRVWTDDTPSAWSPVATWEMALLAQSDWGEAAWIRIEKDTRPQEHTARPVQTSRMEKPKHVASDPSPVFRKAASFDKAIARARAYVCGIGYHEFYVNGAKASNALLEPGQTSYDEVAFYNVYDITSRVREGENAFGLMVGNGFLGQNAAFAAPFLYYCPPVARVRIYVTFEDGTEAIIDSNTTWRATTGPVVYDNVYCGETYDARQELGDWSSPGYDDATWQQAMEVVPVSPRLRAQTLQPMDRVRTVKPEAILPGQDGKWIVDLGQNLGGWVKIRVNEPAGTVVSLRMAEFLTEEGDALDFDSTGLGATGVIQTDTYICRGGGEEVWEPRFTYHGFRYAEVSGLSKQPGVDQFEGVLVCTAMAEHGNFRCSDETLNKAYDVSLWTILSNSHSIPEDCPHREKCGWMGDAHATAEAVMLNLDAAHFFTKYLYDVETQLGDGGTTYHGRPATPGIPTNIAPGKRVCQEARSDWGAAYVLLPWFMYQYYDDLGPARHHWEHMNRWMGHIEKDLVDGIIEDNGYGDWCPPGGNKNIACPVPLSSTAIYYRTVVIMAEFSRRFGDAEKVKHYEGLAAAIQPAFNKRYQAAVGGTAVVDYGSQTGAALAMAYGLVAKGKEQLAAGGLAYDIVINNGGHHTTGIHGHRHLYDMLMQYGYDQVAYDTITEPTYPSLRHMIDQGLTTWPERESSWEQGQAWTGGSGNHPMQAGFLASFHKSIAGISPSETGPGFKRIIMRPGMIGQLDWAEATHQSPQGEIRSAWKRDGDRFLWRVTIPCNTVAEVYVPAAKVEHVEEHADPNLKFLGMRDGRAVFEVGSGEYIFSNPRVSQYLAQLPAAP